ncbi:uncharacterized protein BDW70DRAFT_144524 [Aspergillus foveolatus]|uniref:uncharacterized protein n=1 Tax=Aspergillus foveolatus TaxID=210207 RepID=UPI003CCE540F
MASTPFLILLTTLVFGLATSQEFQTVELDQIFPRNETYAPVRYFPFVWVYKMQLLRTPLALNYTGGFHQSSLPSLFWRKTVAFLKIRQ